MANNQFVARRGLIALADSQITGSLNISQNIVAGGTVQATFDTSTATAISGAFDSVSSSLASDITLNASSISSLNAASSSYLLNTTDTFTGTLSIDGTTTVNDTIAGNFTTNYDTKVLVGGEIIARSLTANESMVSIGGDSNGAFIKSGKQDGSLTDRPLNLITGEDTRLTITSAGKVAINGDSTDGFLEVRQSDNTPSIRLNNGSNPNGAYYDILSNTGGNLYLSRNGSTIMTLSDTNGNVGIGTTDVNAKLRVVGGDVVVTGGKLGIGISSPRADITVDHVIDTLPNNTVDDTDAWNNTEKSHIFIEGTNNAMAIGISGGNNSRRGWLQVGHNNTSFANATGRLLLQPLGGLVGIGLFDAETPLHIKAATAEIKLESSDTGGGAGDVLGGIDIWGNDFSGTGRDSRAYVKAVYEDVFARTALVFGVGPYNTTATETVRFPSTGGITFNGDTAAANALDDYEEGTWTPTFSDQGNVTSLAKQGDAVYTKIGRVVHLTMEVSGAFTSSTAESLFSFTVPFSAYSTTFDNVGTATFFIGSGADRFGIGSVFLGTTSNGKTFVYIPAREVQQSGSWGQMRISLTYFAQ